ncbi:L-ribulose-5-phosphate 4-epimerase [Candidatus Latescibacterota bacterium]
MYKYKELREQVWEANMQLPASDLVIYTFGNVSGIDRANGIIAIKPSGVPYEKLKPEHMVLVDMDYNVVDSDGNPSSDTKTHVVLYKNFPEIGGVVHTHSTYATAWAQAQLPIPCLGTTHADYVHGDIPCSKIISDEQIAGDYEEETGMQIVERLKGLSAENVPMVLVAGHGPFTWGETPDKAVHNSAILEELAKMATITLGINSSAARLGKTLIDKHFYRKHGDNAYYGQKD